MKCEHCGKPAKLGWILCQKCLDMFGELKHGLIEGHK